MCGICGIFSANKLNSEKITKAVQTMIEAMRHRGPDASGLSEFACATLGMARLAILDTTEAGNQPMHSPDGLVTMVYNGETYNSPQLRGWLENRGHVFKSSSDTEVLLKLYLEKGGAFLKQLQGMFALSILDRRKGPGKEKIILARDPFGIKPLLYKDQCGTLIFASEIKALLVSGYVPRDIDVDALRLLLSFGSVSQPKTLISGVSMLEPGCMLVMENGRTCIQSYFSFAASSPELIRQEYSTQLEIVKDVLQESTRLQMISDVPIGAFLSGGLDSGLLCALMIKTGANPLNTFSVGFEKEGESIDESQDAFETANYLGTRHTHIVIQGEDVSQEINRIAQALDQPSVDGVNTYFVSREARKHVTVAISGSGGDEIFAGYPWFGQMREWCTQNRSIQKHMARFMSLPIWNRLAPGRLGPWLEESRINADFVSRYAMCYYIFGPTGTSRLLAKDIRNRTQLGRAMSSDMKNQDVLAKMDTLSRVSGLCLRGYTANQLLRDIDCTSMFHSLEIRVPYLDTKVLGIALSLPENAKLSILPNNKIPDSYQDGLKRILYDIAKPLLPENLGRRTKRGFVMPFDHWLKGPLNEIFNDCLSHSTVSSAGLFDPYAVDMVKKSFESGKIMWMKPWLLMMTELWRREVLNATAISQ